jgi:hypothetical protein
MRRPLTALLLIALAGLAACGSEDSDTPAACLQGSGAYRAALQRAPSHAELGGDTPISDCLVQNQSAGELATVGSALVRVATELNAEARANPAGRAPYELGYLVGALRRGAEDTAGVHAELLRRVESAARFSPAGKPQPASFRAAYQRGLRAGLEGG